MKICMTKKSDETWKKLMKLGENTGCHQLPERSFFFRNYQFPVCARCTGVITGYIIAVPIYVLSGFHKRLSILLSLIMLGDWSFQKSGVKESTNIRRFITGVLGGFGVISLQIRKMSKVGRKLFKKRAVSLNNKVY